MRKFIYFVVIIFILFLLGCVNNLNSFKFRYELMMDNYIDFIEISIFIFLFNEGVKFI